MRPSRGVPCGPHALGRALAAVGLLAWPLLPWAQTLPSGGVAIHGQAQITQPAANQLLVTTQNGAGTNHSAINWQSFSIGQGASAHFAQPSAASLSINRVVTNTPSALFGNLSSNGHLVLVNQSGIAIGAGAMIDTAGLTASTLRMTDADAIAGRLRFGDAGVLGAATLAVDGQILARYGDAVLIAPQLETGASALVQAPNGATVLAAGQQVEITGRGLEGIRLVVQAPEHAARNLGTLTGDAVGIFAGTLRHSGQIAATTATLEGGRVVLKAAGDAVVDGQARIDARGTGAGAHGGSVDVLGEAVALAGQASVDVSGPAGGGSIRIGGDFQGRNPEIPNAALTYVGTGVTLRADATHDGDAGRVIVWADDAARVHGHIAASAAGGGGGGLIETSGKQYLDIAGIRITAEGSAAQPGQWLIDPADVTILHDDTVATNNFTFSDFNLGPGSIRTYLPFNNNSISSITDGTLNSVLNGNSNLGITITTSNTGGAGNGDITFDGAINGGIVIRRTNDVNTNANTLRLIADRNIVFKGNTLIGRTSSGGAGLTVVLEPGQTTTGKVFTEADATVEFQGNGAPLNVQLQAAKLWENAGLLTLNGNASLRLAYDPDFGFAKFNNLAGASVDINSTATWSLLSDASLQASEFNNAGTVNVNTASTSWEALYSNLAGGVLNIGANSTVSMQNGGTIAGLVNIGTDGQLILSEQHSGPVAFTNTSFTGGGALGVQSGVTANLTNVGGSLGELLVRGNVSLASGSLSVARYLQDGVGGDFSGAGSLTVTQSFSQTSGTFTPTGNLSITQTSGDLNFTKNLNLASLSLAAPNGDLVVDGVISTSGAITLSAGTDLDILRSLNAAGAFSASTTNAAGLMTVGEMVFAGGAMNLSLAGGLRVQSGASVSAALNASAGQDIVARYLEVFSTGSAAAYLYTANGLQSVATTGANASGEGITVRNQSSQYAQIYSGGTQSITVENADTVRVRSLGSGHASIATAGGSQSVTLRGSGQNLLQVGDAGGSGNTSINGANQSITAGLTGELGGIEILGGAVDGKTTNIYNAAGNQTITTTGTITLTGGTASGLTGSSICTDVGACAIIDNGAGSAQNITASGFDIRGGSSGGYNTAAIQAATNATQMLTVTGGGTMALRGGAGAGTRNEANIYTGGASQTVNFTAGGTLDITGGTVGSANRARIETWGTGSTQTVSGADAIVLTGGASGGGVGSGNRAQILSAGNQSVSVGAGGITLTGGGGALTSNTAEIYQYGTAGTTQQVTIQAGGNLDITGGSSAGTNVGTGEGSNAAIYALGDAQQVIFTAGGNITLVGGTGGSRNRASIGNDGSGSQTISGVQNITLTGGANGGVTGEPNRVAFYTQAGSQTITATGLISLNGGADGIENRALISAVGGDQTISANGIGMQAGSGVGNRVGINVTAGSQSITVGSAGIQLTGGNGSASEIANYAVIYQSGDASTSQHITVNGGGDITLQGGTSAGLGVGTDNGSFASITSDGAAQLIEFGAPGSVIAITAGSVGSLNSAGMYARAGNQTIRGTAAGNAPTITLQGGASGGTATEANSASISAAGLQTIVATNVALTAGASGLGSGTYIRAPQQVLDFSGDLTLTGSIGGDNNSNSRIGGQTNSNTDLRLSVGGDLVLLGGTGANASIGTSGSANNFNLEVTITAGGDITLGTIGTLGGRIGASLNATGQTGNVSVTAGGNISLAGGIDNTIRAPGNVTLVAGGAITQAGSSGYVQATSLSASAHSGIDLHGVTNLADHAYLNNSSTGGITYHHGGTYAGGELLTLTGIDHAGSGAVSITADDLAITGPVNAGSAQVFLFPRTASRTVAIEGSAGSGVLSLSPGELQLFHAQELSIGRLDGTGNLTVSTFVPTLDLGALNLYAGGNVVLQPGSGFGDGGNRFSGNLQLRAGGDIALDSIGIYLANNRSLQLTADQDTNGLGNVSISNTIAQVGSDDGNTSGNMQVSGNLINVGTSSDLTTQLQVFGSGNQSVVAQGNLSLVNTNTGTGRLGIITNTGTQTIAAGNSLRLEAGDGTATVAEIFSRGSQSITAGSGGITMLAGGGLADNAVWLSHQGATGTQTITVNGGGTIRLEGGSSTATSVGSGHGSRAGIESLGTAQTIQFTAGGAIELIAGTVGSRNYAQIYTDAVGATQTITGTPNILVRGGADGGVAGEGNYARVASLQSAQNITAGDIVLEGGAAGIANSARIQALTGQTISAASITVTGGGGTQSDNLATILQNGGAGTSQSITLRDGGSIVLQGGTSAQTNVGGFGHGSFAAIESQGSTQNIVFASGGNITLTGGTNGSRNLASIYAPNAAQSITGVDNITLSGGASGGVDGEGNSATVQAGAGGQTIIANGTLSMTGGDNGLDNFTLVYTPGNQQIQAFGITLLGGAGGGGIDTGNSAIISANGTQNVTVDEGGLRLTGGSGAFTDNTVQVYQGGTAGTSQTITIHHGGTFSIQGGSTAMTNVGGAGHGSRALVEAAGDSQTVSFTGGGTLELVGGSMGSRNFASLSATNGTQTVTGADLLTATGGSSGGIVGESNSANVVSAIGNQTITVGAISLQGGDGGTETLAQIRQGTDTTGLGSTQTITVTGSGGVSLQGGGGTTSFARIIGYGTTQTLDFDNTPLTLTGGTGASNNYARIYAVNGDQDLQAGTITLRGGASGGITDSGNFAQIRAFTGAQTINAISLELIGGLGGADTSASITGANQVLSFSDNVTLTGAMGGDANSGARIGGVGGATPTATQLTLFLGGDLLMQAGTTAGVAIGGTSSTTGVSSNIDITVGSSTTGGNVTLIPLGTQGARIGSPSSTALPGSLTLTAGRSIDLQAGSGTGNASLRTGGNMTLYAGASASGSITQGANSVVQAQTLDLLVNGDVNMGTSLNRITQLQGAVTGSHVLHFNNDQALVLGNIASGGDLYVSANGAITQAAGTSINVTRQASFNTYSMGWADITLANSGNDFGYLAVNGNNVHVVDTNGLILGTYDGMYDDSDGETLRIHANGPLTLTGTLTAHGTGDALVLSSTAGAFDASNTNAAIDTPNGRWLLYLADSTASHNLGSIAPEFKQYGATVGSTILGASTDNGLLFANTAAITAILNGSPSTKVYDGTTALTIQQPDTFVQGQGVLSGDTVQFALLGAGTLADKNVGTAKSVTVGVQIASVTGAGGIPVFGYSFQDTGTTTSTASGNVGEVTPATITVLGLDAATKVYDATTAATPTWTSLQGQITGDALTLAIASATFDTKNVGTDKTVTLSGLTLGGADAGNYVLAGSTTATVLADITPATISAVTGIAAQNKVYDSTTAATLVASGAAFSGMFSGDVLTVASATGTFADKNVGPAKAVGISGITLGGADAGNYVLANATATAAADITKATISSIGGFTVTRVYDSTTLISAGATIGGTPVFGGLYSGDQLTLAAVMGDYADKNVASGKALNLTAASLGGTDSGNYQFAGSLGGTGTITPATISAVTGIAAQNKVYDSTTAATLAASGAAFGGMFSGDVLTVASATGTFADKNVGTAKAVGISGITLGGADAGNYVLASSTASAAADITKAPLTLNLSGVTAASKVYDGTRAAQLNTTGATLSGVLGGDDVSKGTITGQFADKNVGAAKPITFDALGVVGADAGNYDLGFGSTTPLSADITPAMLSAVSGVTVNKVYDGTMAFTGATFGGTPVFSGMLAGDQLQIASASGSYADSKNVGSGKPVSFTSATLGGADAGNYQIAGSISGTGSITPATISAVNGFTVSRVYDGTTLIDGVASVGGTPVFSGLVSGDQITLASVTGSFTDNNKNVGANKPVALTGATLGGADAGNYQFAGSVGGSGTGDITPRSLGAIGGITAQNKTYDGSIAASLNLAGVTFNGMVPGDVLTATGATGNFSDANVDRGKTVNISGISLGGADAGNYVLTSASATTVADILALASTTWTGTGENNLWSNPANWALGAVPVGQNVLAVVIPTGSGSIVFDTTAGSTTLQSLTSARPVVLSGGTLDIGSLLQTAQYSQSGGALTGVGRLEVNGSFTQSGGSIAVGTVDITQAAGNLTLGQINAGSVSLEVRSGAIVQAGGSALLARSLLASATQGIALGNAGNRIGAMSLGNNGSGNVVVQNTGELLVGTMANLGGSIEVRNTGGVSTSEAVVRATQDVRITAFSPITVGSGGITAGNDIILAAGTESAPGPTDNLTLNGNLQAGNLVNLFAGNELTQIGAVYGANGVTARALGKFTYGPLATTNNPPVSYRLNGVEVSPPQRVAGQSVAVGVTGVLDTSKGLQDLVDGGPPTDLQKEREKDKEAIVAEGEICK